MSLLDTLEFEAPLSRVEEILQNILGAENDVDPESRVEKLFQNLIEVAYEVDPESRVELLIDNLLGGQNEVVPMSRVEMLLANTIAGDDIYDVAPQSRVEELLVLLAEQYAVEYKTVSGSVVSVSDALEAPMKSLKVSIDPVQDLHGYDSPWPAGGGKNLLNFTAETSTVNGITFTVNSDGTISATGTATDNATLISPIQGNVNIGETYRLNGCPSGGWTNTYEIMIIAKNNNAGYEHDYGNGTRFTYDDYLFSRIQLVVRSGNTVNLVFKPMIRLESETDGTYAPYSNICQITGWTGAQVTRTGKNLLDADGVASIGNNWQVKKGTGIKLKGGQTYTATVFSDTAPTLSYFRPLGGNDGLSAKAGRTVTYTPSNDESVWLDFYWASGTGKPSTAPNIQLELGSTATAYEPYQGNTYSVSWQSEAGTVYGGTLDVVSGELVVDRTYIIFDGSEDEIWYTYSNTGYRVPRNNMGLSGNGICNIAPTVSSASSYGVMFSASNNYIYFFQTVSEWGVATLADLRAWLATNNVEVCYELAEPITYHLTPTEVRTLLGQNNVWADTGDVEVTYLTKKH